MTHGTVEELEFFSPPVKSDFIFANLSKGLGGEGTIDRRVGHLAVQVLGIDLDSGGGLADQGGCRDPGQPTTARSQVGRLPNSRPKIFKRFKDLDG